MTVEKVEGAKYVMVDNSTYIGENYAVGTVITLINDDGTAMPLFSDADGNKKYVRMRDVVKLVGEVIPAEPEFDCPELVYGNIYTDNDGWTFRYTKTDNKKRGAEVTGGPTIDYNGDYHFGNDGFIHFYEWRKATAEEVAKLEAAEKEHGYVPPLVNEVGTVIEAGKYYAMGHAMIRVDSVSGGIFTGTYVTKSYVVIPDLCIHIGSGYVRSAVPATEAQIAVFDAAVALHEAQKAFREVA